MGYSDHLVADLLDEFEIKEGQHILDPFCGSGTTLVECKKRNITSTGIDANPSSCFASAVKTTWTISPDQLESSSLAVAMNAELEYRAGVRLDGDPTYSYVHSSGMYERGWISERPLKKAVALKQAILRSQRNNLLKSFLLLALICEVVRGASNVKFGPELYCGKAKGDADVFRGFLERCDAMASDLRIASAVPHAASRVFLGDARALPTSAVKIVGGYDAVICSPPYPTEHDYTRNSRLELAFLEQVSNVESLRVIKKTMLRSHTKGIYIDDDDAANVSRIKQIRELADRIARKSVGETNGFAKLYPSVVRHYFGGMRKHFRGLAPLLRKGAKAAYIVGDQASYHRTHIPTAEILGKLARDEGFSVIEIREWRERRATGGNGKNISENILLLQKK